MHVLVNESIRGGRITGADGRTQHFVLTHLLGEIRVGALQLAQQHPRLQQQCARMARRSRGLPEQSTNTSWKS